MSCWISSYFRRWSKSTVMGGCCGCGGGGVGTLRVPPLVRNQTRLGRERNTSCRMSCTCSCPFRGSRALEHADVVDEVGLRQGEVRRGRPAEMAADREVEEQVERV